VIKAENTPVEHIRQFFTAELMLAMGLQPHGWPRRLVDPLARWPTHRLAQLAAAFENRLAQSGLAAAARWLLFQFVESVEMRGAAHIPTAGPLLITANHPAVYEALAIAANLGRNDLQIVISGQPFTHALPATARHTICVDPDSPGLAVRSMIQQLQAGGAILLFPSGLIDPDPDIETGSAQVIEAWPPSIELLLRHVPETRLVVAIVSGVLTKSTLHNPLTRLVKAPWNKRKAALIVQLIQQLAFGKDFKLNLRVTFGKPVTIVDLEGNQLNLTPEIIKYGQTVLATHSLNNSNLS
jgi:hypothetical protein